MRLVKHTPPKYHPAASNTLRLRSLVGLRKLENPDLLDQLEGKMSVDLKFATPTRVSYEAVATLFGFPVGTVQPLSVAPGEKLTSIGNGLQLDARNPNYILVNGEAKVNFEHVDGLTFCMSIDRGNFVWPYRGTVESWWVREENIKAFCSALIKAIKFRLKPWQLVAPISCFDWVRDCPIEIAVNHCPVEYRGRSNWIGGQKHSSAAMEQIAYSQTPFNKSEEFEKEQEYRFFFIFTAFGSVVGFDIPEILDVPLDGLRPYLEFD